MATSSEKLLKILRGRMEWKGLPFLIHDQEKLPSLSYSHFIAVLTSVLELSFNSNFYAPITTIVRDNEYRFGGVRPYGFQNYYEMVSSFTQELRALFMVPKLHNELSEALKKNELIAAFICFLVRLLHHGTGLVFSIYEDMIHNFKKELRSLVMVLGDTSLLSVGCEIEKVETFLNEFESVANEAGGLVFSFFFDAEDIGKTCKLIDAFLQHMEILKTNIVRISNLPPLEIIENRNVTTPEAAVVGSFSIIVSVLRDIEELMTSDNDLILHIKGQLKIVHQGLMLYQSFLKDIKVLPLSEMEDLKEIVMRITDVAYEAEYLISSLLVRDAPLWYLIIRIPNVIHKNKLIGTGIQEIKEKYDIGALKLAKDFRTQLSLQAKRNSVVEDIIVGLEDKTTYILDLLTGGNNHLQIISIFGMPGLGKTTLAKKLYNHPSVNYYFDKLSWCIVSQTYQMKSLLSDMLTTLESEIDSDIVCNMGDEILVERIYKSLKGRRYLIVMDDIWDSNVWYDLRRCFPDDGNGSRILFTSRNKDVFPPNSVIHELNTLSNEQCWELLQKKVFGNETCPPQLLDIGYRIAASCQGLPLAVVVVAGILTTMDREKTTWEDVGRSLTSYIFDDQKNPTVQILELSYDHLPDHLKPCFLYFTAFSKYKEIPVWNLKWLWIAEGFIRKQARNGLESVAEEYLMELIGKSLVTVGVRRSDGGVKTCVIHDLLRDLCLRRAEEQNFMKVVLNTRLIYGKERRLCVPTFRDLMNRIYESSNLLWERCYLGLPLSVRSLFIDHMDLPLSVRSLLADRMDPPLNFLLMELLRVLDIGYGYIDGVELLVHLRYLHIYRMPSSLGRFVNLEFLLLHETVYISSNLLKMTKLRYLKAKEAIFDEDCDTVINNLEYLSTVRISNLKDEEMIKFSPHLRKLKCRCKPFDNGESYRYPDLRFLTQLESLRMAIFKYNRESTIATIADLNLPSNINKLTLSGLGLPWEKMSIVGTLPNLKVLKLEGDAFVGSTWETEDGEFQQLRFLKLKEITSLCDWNVSSWEHFPMLYQLVLYNCSILKEIPREIGEIPTLQVIEVTFCKTSLGNSAVQIQEEQRDMGNEDLRVRMIGMSVSENLFYDKNEKILVEGWNFLEKNM